MNKQFSLNKKFLILLLLAVAIILIVPAAFLVGTMSSADTTSLGGTFTITAKNNNSVIIDKESSTTYNGGTIDIYKWNKARTLAIAYEHDDDNLPPIIINEYGDEVYNINVSLQYLKGYLDSNFENHVEIDNVFAEKKNVLLEDIDQSFSYNIDEGVRLASSQTNINGWGIYRFKISINGAEKFSNYIFVEPDYEVTTAPSIKYDVVHSPNSMHDSFEFSISDPNNNYRYVDTNYLVWYVTGESTDGLKYVLTSQDLASERFENYDRYLYENISRTGTKFLFNDNEVAGKWNVWCEFTNRGESTSVLPSTTIAEVQTSQNVGVAWVAWVVIGGCVAAIGVVTLLAFLRSKKEKVW